MKITHGVHKRIHIPDRVRYVSRVKHRGTHQCLSKNQERFDLYFQTIVELIEQPGFHFLPLAEFQLRSSYINVCLKDERFTSLVIFWNDTGREKQQTGKQYPEK